MKIFKFLFFVLLASCQISEDVAINSTENTTFRVNVSRLGVEKVPINGRVAVIPSDQQNITFFRTYGAIGEDSGNNYVMHKTFSPIPENSFEVTFGSLADNTEWRNNNVAVYTTSGDSWNDEDPDIFVGGDPKSVKTIDNSHIYVSTISLQQDIEEYQIVMNTICYELVISADIQSNVEFINIEYYFQEKHATYLNADFDYLGDAISPETIQLESTNGIFQSDIIVKIFGQLEIKKVEFLDNAKTIIETLSPNFHMDTEAGKQYNLKIPDFQLQSFTAQNMNFSAQKITSMLVENSNPINTPRTIDENGNLVTNSPSSWTSGFFAGSLWYLADYFKTNEWTTLAKQWSVPLEVNKTKTSSHDLGIMLYNSFGNGYRITNDVTYKNILIEGANSLITRYDSNVGLIRSWDWGSWNYPVIIDNMMNLEYLCWASKATGDPKYKNIAINHADNTITNHFRADWSSYHVVDYQLNGVVIKKETYQGYSDESAWARGQAWGLYGFTMMFRETGDVKYLQVAENIANFIINHPNLPDDKIPYWDFDAPGTPKRDASAAAIISSALFELNQHTNNQSYFDVALEILENLASTAYKAVNEKNGNFILKHSVGNLPNDSEIDVPIVYADYYFIEALLRYEQIKLN